MPSRHSRQAQPLVSDQPLFPVRRTHLDRITGPLGIWQHAIGDTPDETFGSCTDDVARALAVDVLHARTLGWQAVNSTALRSLTFLTAAHNRSTGAFRNFRSADGAWLDEEGSQDTQGRALLGLATAARLAPDGTLRADALALFKRGLPAPPPPPAPGAVASAILGCDAALAAGDVGETERVFAV